MTYRELCAVLMTAIKNAPGRVLRIKVTEEQAELLFLGGPWPRPLDWDRPSTFCGIPLVVNKHAQDRTGGMQGIGAS